jgi:HPt (histidine-containing phosphotransfer) domain-containing protein
VSNDIELAKLEAEFGSVESAELVEMFCQNAGLELDKMRIAVADQNRERLIHNARGLRGVCQSCYVVAMGLTCGEIEEAGKSSNWSEASKLIERLANEFSVLKASLAK